MTPPCGAPSLRHVYTPQRNKSPGKSCPHCQEGRQGLCPRLDPNLAVTVNTSEMFQVPPQPSMGCPRGDWGIFAFEVTK